MVGDRKSDGTARIRSGRSGASIADLFAPQGVLGGPNPPQLAALDAGVDVVTLQIGGDDIGFSQILERCAAPLPVGAPCQDAYLRGGVDELGRRIDAAGPKVAAALAEVRRRSPGARVFVVGYPTILPEAYPGCWPANADRARDAARSMSG